MKLKNIFFLTFIFSIIFISFSFDHNVYASITKTHTYMNTTGGGWSGGITWAEKFTGLIPGENTTQVSLNVTTHAGNVRAKIYADNGTTSSTTTTANYFGSGINPGGSNIWLEKFTGLPAGQTISSESINESLWWSNPSATMRIYADNGTSHYVYSTNNYIGNENAVGSRVYVEKFTGLPVGHFITNVEINETFFWDSNSERIKVYKDDGSGGSPSTLITESGSIIGGGTGLHDFAINATIPASGNVWIGFEETDPSGNLDRWRSQQGLTNGTMVSVAHTYGSGPSPFGSGRNENFAFWMKITYSQDTTGYPGKLLGSSSSTAISGQGIHTVSVSATIPANGNVWAGFSYNDPGGNSDQFWGKTGLSLGTSVFCLTTSPCGTATDQTFAPWMKLTYTSTISGYPKTLLAETGSTSVSSNGIFNFPISAKIPNDGNLWVAFETDTSSLLLSYAYNLFSGSSTVVSHTYGSGPSPFGTPSDQTFAPWLSVTYDTPTLSITPGGGSVGSSATLSGTKFGINNVLNFKFNGNSISTTPATVTTDHLGQFNSTTIIIPVLPNGVYTINGTNNAGIFATTSFTIGSTLNVNPTSGNVGSSATLSGNGYLANTIITVKYDGVTVSTTPATVTTDHLGQFNSTTIIIPSSIKGNHNIQVTDGTNSVTSSYTVIQNIILTPTTGIQGDTITIKGNGFAGTSTTNFKFNGNSISTTPATVTTNSTGSFTNVQILEPENTISTYTVLATDGSTNMASASFSVTGTMIYTKPCGAGVCSPKLVNYTATRSIDFKTLNLVVHVNPVPFNLECLITNGTFIQHSAWHNFTQIGSANFGTHVVPDDNAFYACHGSGLLFSGTSPGNATAIITAAKAGDESIGQFLGVPLGVFFIVLAASLANQRTGSIYAVIVLAMIGIAGLVGFFTLDPKIWGAAVVTGMLALLLGKKIW